MSLKQHPLVRTAQDIRRSMHRLERFAQSPLPVPEDEKELAQELYGTLDEAHKAIPAKYRDADLEKE